MEQSPRECRTLKEIAVSLDECDFSTVKTFGNNFSSNKLKVKHVAQTKAPMRVVWGEESFHGTGAASAG